MKIFWVGKLRFPVILTLLCAMTAASAWGQATAQIHGTVQDASGAAVPDALVKATQTDTALTRTATSEADGSYVLTTLPLGPYTLEVTKDGFTTAVERGVVLRVSSDPMVRITLKVGTLAERVTVEADAYQVETRSVGVGTTLIESQRILELPLNGRQATDLITLSGLAVQTDTTANGAGYNMPGGVNISVAGGTSYSVQYNLDGASHLDTYDGTNMPLPFPDALQEFRLVTSTQDSSGGGHSGASVNAVTKSGANVFHGDAFEFFRNAALNGKDFFATQNDGLKRSQFGGVIGGPIKKDKLFFFVGYQGTITRQTPNSTIEFVPTAAMQTGDFSAYVDPKNHCAFIDPAQLDASHHLKAPLSPAALAIAAKLPKALDACGTVKTGDPLHENDLQIPARLDYHLSDRNSLFARYLATRIEKMLPYKVNPSDLLTTDGVGNDDMAQSLALGDTFVFSATFVNSFRLFGNRIGGYHAAPNAFTPQDVGIKNFYGGYNPGLVSILAPGAFQIGFTANFFTTKEGVTNFGLDDDVTLIRGSHQFSFGGSVMRAILNEKSYAWSPGIFIFPGAVTTNPIADFLTGTYTVLHQANPNPNNTTQNFFALYAGDTWKATSHLTLNYGVRWNPFFPMQFIYSDVYNFSLPSFFAGTRSTVIPTAPPGFSYPGDPGFPGRAGLNHKLGNFEPRFGFAWDPSGDGKMAIRGGAGIAYDFIRQDLHQNTSSVAPFRLTVINNFGQLDDPYANVPGGNPFPYTFDAKNPVFPSTPLYQGFYPIPRNLKTTQQYTWNLGIQRQLTPSLFASATYVGTQLIHTWTAVDLNPGQFVPGSSAAPTGCPPNPDGTFPNTCPFNVNQRRLLEQLNPSAGKLLGSLTQLDDGGTQHYHGLLLNATWKKGNVNLAGNFTWSRCIGLAQIGVTNIQSTYPHQPYQNNGPINRYMDYGDCFNGALDVRRVGNVTMVVNTPKFSGTWERRLGTGWTFSTIVTARSGWPLTVNVGGDVAENGLYQGAGNYPIPQRPDQILANTAAANRGQSCPGSNTACISYFNPLAFQAPTPGTYGNMGVGSLRSPGFWEWDQTISRQFKIRESQSIEIRAEAFNVTNSLRLYIAPTGDNAMLLGSPTFGNITEAASTTGSSLPFGSGGRILQLAFKYIF